MTQKDPTRPEPEVILEGIVGSTAYGLATPDSDVARIGVFLEPVTSLLRLEGLPKKQQSWVGPKDSGDRALHELGKFCDLVLGGNPTYTELLWLPDDLYVTRTEIGDELIAMRESFLSAKLTRDAYFGYAVQQFTRLGHRSDGTFSSDTGKRTEKHARHMARLLYQGYQLWATGEVVVRLPADVALSCRKFGELLAAPITADWPDLPPDHPYWCVSWIRFDGREPPRTPAEAGERLLSYYQDLFDETPTVLPDRPNREKVNQWLINLRLEQARYV